MHTQEVCRIIPNNLTVLQIKTQTLFHLPQIKKHGHAPNSIAMHFIFTKYDQFALRESIPVARDGHVTGVA